MKGVQKLCVILAASSFLPPAHSTARPRYAPLAFAHVPRLCYDIKKESQPRATISSFLGTTCNRQYFVQKEQKNEIKNQILWYGGVWYKISASAGVLQSVYCILQSSPLYGRLLRSDNRSNTVVKAEIARSSG